VIIFSFAKVTKIIIYLRFYTTINLELNHIMDLNFLIFWLSRSIASTMLRIVWAFLFFSLTGTSSCPLGVFHEPGLWLSPSIASTMLRIVWAFLFFSLTGTSSCPLGVFHEPCLLAQSKHRVHYATHSLGFSIFLAYRNKFLPL
jgi:hypothetical protein